MSSELAESRQTVSELLSKYENILGSRTEDELGLYAKVDLLLVTANFNNVYIIQVCGASEFEKEENSRTSRTAPIEKLDYTDRKTNRKSRDKTEKSGRL